MNYCIIITVNPGNYNRMGSRREFIKQSAVAGIGLPIAGTSVLNGSLGKAHLTAEMTRRDSSQKYPVCIFSKHLQFLGYEDMADAIIEAGMDGADLGVRKGSHVEPERVEEDLPRAVEALRSKGLQVPMMVTRINDPDDPATEPILKTAAEQGIGIYRMAYYKYNNSPDLRKSFHEFRSKMEGLAEINKKYGIHGAYQNHSGRYFGSPVWDLWLMLKDMDPEWVGCQYDIRHAVLEGANSWPLGLQLLKPFIKCVVVKDFIWEKNNGKWKMKNVPMGEGMVDFDEFFGILREYDFTGPVSMHFEYPFFDEDDQSLTITQKTKSALDNIKRDVSFLRTKMSESGLT